MFNEEEVVIPEKDIMLNSYNNLEVDNTYVEKDKLIGSICIPSCAHAYSIGVELFRDWLLERIDEKRTYFKTVFINGRHMIHDYQRYSLGELISRSKPAIAITPQADMEYDRNMVDMYMGGANMIINKFNHEQCFFKDYDRKLFIGMGIREQKIDFNVRTKHETRAEQFDFIRVMEFNLKIGFTHKGFINADFHVPTEIILNIAKMAEFEVVENKRKDLEVKNKTQFLEYLNMHSNMQFTCKLRAMTGKEEYFVRAQRVYFWVDTRNKLSYDDGEREGNVDNNFHIDMNASLSIWVPSYYVLTSGKKLVKEIPILDSAVTGLYTCEFKNVPKENPKHWSLLTDSAYAFDKEEMGIGVKTTIDISTLLTGNIKRTLDFCNSIGLSIYNFIDLVIFGINDGCKYKLDNNGQTIYIEDITIEEVVIAVYINNEFVNNVVGKLANTEKTRIS